MMRSIVIFILILSLQNTAARAQETIGKSQNENLKELSNSIFMYPEFSTGTIFLKDGSLVNKKLNYNRIIGKLFFLDRQGQSRIFADTNNISQVTIASDTFFLYNNNFLKKLSHHASVNLYRSQRIDYINNDKSSREIVVTDASKLRNNAAAKNDEFDRNSSFNLINTYFIGDAAGKIYPASRRNFYDLFPAHENELKKYLHSHNVNFENADDMENLLAYMQSL